MYYGYHRTSTKEQHLDRGITEITTFCEKNNIKLVDSPGFAVIDANVSLEDLFTIFDSVASGREHFRLYSSKEMADLHNQLKLCIIFTLSFFIANNCDNTDYKKFCEHLLQIRNQLTQKEDALAVITMNWDDILETTLSELCSNHNKELSKNQDDRSPPF